jgi:hypothetical protein
MQILQTTLRTYVLLVFLAFRELLNFDDKRVKIAAKYY